MAKNISFFITNELDELVSCRIKSKTQIVQLILECTSTLLSNITPIDNQLGAFNFYISQMKRIFFHYPKANKFFSISYPFSIEIDDDDNFHVWAMNKSIEITPYFISLLRSLSEQGWFDEKNMNNDLYGNITELEEVLEEYGATYDELGFIILDLVNLLRSFEVGYIRCDIEDHANFKKNSPHIHPINHLDVNYSQHSTYKIGLKRKMDENIFFSLLDIESDCLYID